MSLLLRTTALMLFMLSRAPAFAATIPVNVSSQTPQGEYQNEINAQRFKHSLSGLYGIQSTHHSVIQPYSNFDELYQKASDAQLELEALCTGTAMLTSAQALFSGTKSRSRALEKIALELNGQPERITDLARATIIADDVPSLVEAYEVLGREARIVKVKNRFKTPAASGYRDLNLLVELPKSKIIAEVQLHLKAIAEVKSGPEHALYEQIQHIERNASQEQRQLTDWEVAKIHQIRHQSLNLYQQAWQPYITTNIQAA
ncbi:RelA/SpoT domain-containing protein [Vibrio metschnikovii]|uniref:RelA/SpoT domain-containing protein n=2 Tax=Unclassified Bacteria TaxID=49928 RepID=A0AAU6UY45_UNCXX|nr:MULTISPECIES: RelA/SpoT domain-containing protein [unclassified Vibrio]EKO3582773.1 RelA/SpoT domain-containing protein [Vibrio metschnikovii]EKO3592258.1 RelA/SpoT domain-containing protein [Vibrio metschnikovii]EKO3598814.1 RelA/SpoT domain-containing protein [Vibrio metschnikovii]EKO3601560.1 RelA/SpoT domain-containing protein [Vibrio metschnikovii]EKO3639938.1 RelA/SpoT domain-containing protein [Vibrio metschnikovii]